MAHIQHFFSSMRIYLRPKLWVMLLLGFSAGLPYALTAGALTTWLKEVGVDIKSIGLFAGVTLPYALKFLWAPMIDTFRVPLITKWFGRRRAWLIITQLALIGAIILLGSLNPKSTPWLFALAALLVSTSSATQDIIIDAIRIETYTEEEQPVASSFYISSFFIGILISNAGLILYVAHLESSLSQNLAWYYGYMSAAALMGIGVLGTLLIPEPAEIKQASSDNKQNAISKYFSTAWSALTEFIGKHRFVLLIFIFIILFKVTDGLLDYHLFPFLKDIGFDKTEYAKLAKGLGLIAMIISSIFAGLIAYRLPLFTSLVIAVCAQALSNIAFLWLAWVGPEQWALAVTIIIENSAKAIATAIFVYYLASLCGVTLHTATQYALLTALFSGGRTLVTMPSGIIIDKFGWTPFIGLTVSTAIPCILILIFLKYKGHFEDLHYERKGIQATPSTKQEAHEPSVKTGSY